MHWLDWAVLAAYALLSAAFAVWFARRHKAQHSGEDYMIAGRRLPWWVVGIADVATGDGADAIWIFVFFTGGFMAYHRFYWVYGVITLPLGVLWARYWRRLALHSPGQLFEERYGGRAALGFRAIYSVWAAFFGVALVLGYVLQGFSQALQPFLGVREEYILLVFCGTTMLYTVLSGLVAVAYSDVGQFVLVMTGRVTLAVLALRAAGGLNVVLDKIVAVRGPDFLVPYPPTTLPIAQATARYGDFYLDPLSLVALLLYGVFVTTNTQLPIVQRALAAKDELHAAVGQIFNMVLSLVVRTLPMILIALCAIALFPAGRKDTNQWADLVRAHVPPGVVGLLLVGIAAGYMSTLDGLVNFAAAGLLNDLYRRALRPGASDREQLLFGRGATALVLIVGYIWARVIGKVDAGWINFINSVTLLFMLPLTMLRWTWWRINLWGEVVGFLASFPLTYAVWFGLGPLPAFKDRPYWQSFGLLCGSGVVLVVLVTLLTPPEAPEVLERFYRKVRPPGFWGPVAARLEAVVGGGGAALRKRRRMELWLDLRAALLGIVCAASMVVGMGALLSRRLPLGGGLWALATLTAYGFVRLTVQGERERAALTREEAEAPRP